MEILEDLLKVDTDSNKAGENKTLLKKIKQLIKKQNKKETVLEKKAEDLPYEAVSVIGNRLVTVRFSLETKEGIVSNIEVDGRDIGTLNHMATFNANNILRKISIKHRGENGE